jgi:hypothetical protein
MFPYDAAILGAVQNAPSSVTAVLDTLRMIDAICVDTDGLKWFNWLYLQVTLAVEARVTAGGFADVAWLAALDVQFANLYFSALRISFLGQTPAECWQVLFQSRNQNAIARIQFALAGINAHINHDLPEAIVATCAQMSTPPDRGGTHYNDYTAVNSTLDGLVEVAKGALNVRLPGDSLPAVSGLEQTIASWNVSAARDSAWQNAEYLWTIRGGQLLTAGFLDMLDGLTTVIGKTLLVPVP